EAFESLAGLYELIETEVADLGVACRRDGACCRFDTSGLRLYATRLEVAYLLRMAPKPGAKGAAGQCPYQEGSLCQARSGRPLGCRVYFCDEEFSETISALYERFHKAILVLHERYQIEYLYQELLSHSAFH
ncbi:MAG: hypothetical protein ABIK28_08380, partial [Planctomycetota bacterium]